MTTEYQTMTDETAAEYITSTLREFDRQHEHRYPLMGLMLEDAEKRELWKLVPDSKGGLPCRSFNAWMWLVLPQSYSTGRSALAHVKKLKDLPPEQIAQIKQCNMNTIVSLSTAVRRDPDVLASASHATNAEFVRLCQDRFPQQAIETCQPMRIPFTASQRIVVDNAYAKAQEREEASSHAEFFELLAITYSQDAVLEESYTGLATQAVQ